MAKQKSSPEVSPSSADPKLLGVSVPLAMTKTKATEVATAWADCVTALVAVAKSRVLPEKPSAPVASEPAPQPTISA